MCEFNVENKHTSYKIAKGAKYWTAYKLHFEMDIGDQDQSCTPHTTCGSCQSNLKGWPGGSRKSILFAISKIWKESKNHGDDCYFYMTNILKYRAVEGKKALMYLNIPSSTAPVSHDESLPVPSPPQNESYAKLSLRNNVYAIH